MSKTTLIKCMLLNVFVWLSVESFAQELLDIEQNTYEDSLSSRLLRPKNSVSIGLGSSLTNDDLSNPDYENFLVLQLNRFITPKLVISGNVKKFDIKNFDFQEEGYLSGDLNLEWYMLPEQVFTPFIFAGPGLLISNDFDDKNYKVQGGFGLEYLFIENVAVVGSIEVNYIYDEQKGSQLLQQANGLYYNASIGIQYYFGNNNYSNNRNSRKKTIKNGPSVINSNTIDND